jgi:hypothetical protein
MKPDGSPANRDPVFLQETGLVPNAGRLMASQPAGAPGGVLVKVPSFGVVRGPSSKSSIGPIGGLTSSSIDPAVPITMYTEAAAKMTYNGNFYVSHCFQAMTPLLRAALYHCRHLCKGSTSCG